jgi:hypothetical protein
MAVGDLHVSHGAESLAPATEKVVTFQPAVGEVWKVTSLGMSVISANTNDYIKVILTDGTNDIELWRRNGNGANNLALVTGGFAWQFNYDASTDFNNLNYLMEATFTSATQVMNTNTGIFIDNNYYIKLVMYNGSAGAVNIRWHIQAIEIKSA